MSAFDENMAPSNSSLSSILKRGRDSPGAHGLPVPLRQEITMIAGVYRPLRARILNGRHGDGRYGGLRARRRRFLLCFFSQDVTLVTLSSRMVYNARRTRGKAAFSAPLTPCGQQKGAKRQFSPIFVDFDEKTPKLHQNKPEIGITHQFYIEIGITRVIPEIY